MSKGSASALLWRDNARFGAHDFNEILDSSKSGATATDSTADPSVGAGGVAVAPKRRGKPKLTATEHLCDPKRGLRLIYEEFPKMRMECTRADASERGVKRDLKRVLAKYEEWCAQLYPMNFSDLLTKIETFSGNALVKSELMKLRAERDGIVIDDDEEGDHRDVAFSELTETGDEAATDKQKTSEQPKDGALGDATDIDGAIGSDDLEMSGHAEADAGKIQSAAVIDVEMADMAAAESHAPIGLHIPDENEEDMFREMYG